MLWLRSLAFEIGRGFLILFFSVTAQLLWFAPYSLRYRYLSYWSRANLAWLRWTCGLSYRLHGTEYIQADNPALVLAHHESAWETFSMQVIFPRQSYVLKKELLSIPFFGWTLAMLKPIAIDRSAGRSALKHLLQQGRQRLLEQKDWVILFPEGTRVKPGTVGKINKGGALLAKATSVPIHFVSHNAGQFWPKNSLLRKPGVIDFYISPLVQTEDLTVDEINRLARQWFQHQNLDLAAPSLAQPQHAEDSKPYE